MNDNTVESLREALKHSPDNTPLRLLLAETLLTINRLEEAEAEFSSLIKSSNDNKAKVGLATVFYKKGNYSACNVILEEVLNNGTNEISVYTLYAKGLLKENSISKAIEVYKKALAIDPSYFDDELDSQLRQKGSEKIESDEESDNRFLQKPNVNFNDVGGMENVKKEIELKIIKPLLHPELYKAYGKKIGGGILLYGPPGCGKTFIAKATAGQVNAKFISVSLNDILDMWIGNSEKNLHKIFELARNNTPCVLFIDEIDALGASRSDMKQSSGRHLINQFLQELDGIDSTNEGVLIIGATNTPWNLDSAFRRPGRFDRIVFVPPPDIATRESILRLKLKNKPTATIDLNVVAKKSENYSGADIDAFIDIAIEEKLESSFSDGIPKPLETSDLLNALKKHKPSTQEWFSTAKNFAMFANDSGLYDDILTYMKIKSNMIEDSRLTKVEILIQQKRFAEAEKILVDLLTKDSTNVYFLCLLAEVNLQQQKYENANNIIENAIGLSPDDSNLFYIKSRISLQEGKSAEAEKYINQAINLYPYDADYFALLANIKLSRKQFEEALKIANQSLEIDAENLLALNTRSTALNKLDRSEESFETIEGALREDPNNVYTHTNYGWGLLEKGDHKKALEHFKEALSNDPTYEYAQVGLLEAIKATNPIYRIFLKYSFFMSNLTANYQWAVILGFYFGIKVLRTIAKNNEALQPYLIPIVVGLALIAFSTWIITPISNLFLRFNKYGQLLLDKKEKISSNFVAASLCVFLLGLLLYFIKSDEKMLAIAVYGFAMMVPLAAMFSPSKNENALLIYTVALAAIGLIAIGLTFSTGELFNFVTMVFIFGFVAFQWIANYMVIKEDNQ